MGTVTARTRVALTVAALATGGFTLLAGPAQAVSKVPTCKYEVTAPSGLNIRQGPAINDHIITALSKGKRIRATCAATNNFVKTFDPVTLNAKHVRGGWVSQAFLKKMTSVTPKGGVPTGGGGTSNDTSSLLPLTGLGLITLGSGVALASRRRRTTGAVPTA